MKPLLEVKNLSVTYGGETLISNLSFELSPGETLGLIGESGSGKSLTALAILGLLPAGMTSTGHITFNIPGQEPFAVLQAKEKELQRIRGSFAAIVFQEPQVALNPLMKIGKQLSFVAAKDEIDSFLEKVLLREISRIRNSFPFELSGGERQRVAIALALAKNPYLLIADEPTTALDVTIQSEILELLRELSHERSLLFISHDLPVVASMCKKVQVLSKGKLVGSGSIQELANQTDSKYVSELFESAYFLDRTLS